MPFWSRQLSIFTSMWLIYQSINIVIADTDSNGRPANVIRSVSDPDSVNSGMIGGDDQTKCGQPGFTNISVSGCRNNATSHELSPLRDENKPEGDHKQFVITMDASCRMFEFYVSFVMVGITCLFGFVGNVLSIVTLHRDNVRSVTSYLLSALAVADIAFLLPAVFVIMVPTYCEFYQHCTDGFITIVPYLEQYGWALASTCHTCTVYITVLVAVHRYFCVCRIELARSLSGFRRVRIQTYIVAPLALLYNSPRFFEYQVVHYAWNDTSTGEHVIRQETTKILGTVGRNPVFQIGYKNVLFFVVMYLIPLAILITVSISLIKTLKQRRQHFSNLSSISNRAAAQRKRDDSITLVLIIIIATFIVCQTPTMIQRLILTVSGSDYLGCGYFYFYFEHIADYMALLNSSTNFLIYIVFSRHFRRTLIVDVLCGHSTLKYASPAVVVEGNLKRGTGGERDAKSMAITRGPNSKDLDLNRDNIHQNYRTPTTAGTVSEQTAIDATRRRS